MSDVTRWYVAPGKAIAVKGATIRTYYGSAQPVIRITAPVATLERLERRHGLARCAAPTVDDP